MEELQLSAADLRKDCILNMQIHTDPLYSYVFISKLNVHTSYLVCTSLVTVASSISSQFLSKLEEKLACSTRIYCLVFSLETAHEQLSSSLCHDGQLAATLFSFFTHSVFANALDSFHCMPLILFVGSHF